MYRPTNSFKLTHVDINTKSGIYIYNVKQTQYKCISHKLESQSKVEEIKSGFQK